MSYFSIDIVDEHWIDNNPANDTDVCSHGRIFLNIGGQEILGKNDEVEDWTTLTSIYRLLKNANGETILNRDDGLIIHCGMLEMITCPISVDWETRVEGEKIRIFNVKKYLATNDKDMIFFEGLTLTINIRDYKAQIIRAGQKIISFYNESKPRKIDDPEERQSFNDLWKDFTRLMSL